MARLNVCPVRYVAVKLKHTTTIIANRLTFAGYVISIIGGIMPARNVHNILKIYELANASELKHGLNWYANNSDEAASLHADKSLACGIIAACSPGLRWEVNIPVARQIIMGHKPSGGRVWPKNIAKAKRILSGIPALGVLGGNKVLAFYHCLMSPQNRLHVCVDGHAYSIWLGRRVDLDETPNLARRNRYGAISRDYTAAANLVSILPMQMQAITWTVWRRLHQDEMRGILAGSVVESGPEISEDDLRF